MSTGERKNPDVEELQRYNDAACKHERTVERSIAVGVGGGRIGCHMEQRTFCASCGKPCARPLSAELLALMETDGWKKAAADFQGWLDKQERRQP